MSTADTFKVKGSSIRSKLVFLAETQGPAAEERMQDYLKELQAWPVLEASWYPYETYDRLLLWLVKNYLDGDLSRLQEVGRFSAEKALTTTYEAFRTSGDFRRFLGKLPVLHGRYYSHGQLITKLSAPGSRRCDMILEGAPASSDADLTVGVGFYIGCAELMGLQGVSCTYRRDGRRVLLELTWRE